MRGTCSADPSGEAPGPTTPPTVTSAPQSLEKNPDPRNSVAKKAPSSSLHPRRRLAEAEDPGRAEHLEGQGHQAHAAVGLDGEVQVRAAAVAGAAGAADALAAAHAFALADLRAVRRKVGIDGHGAVVVQDADEVGAVGVGG